MTSILHISDTHFGTEVPEVIAALLSFHQQLAPDLVILSGDITQRAKRSQFEKAAEFLEKLQPQASLLIPGNHDIPLYRFWERLARPYGNYRRSMGKNLQPVHKSEDLLVIGVNSTRPSRIQDGEVSKRQIAEVSQQLEQAQAQQLRLVVTHQPLFIVDSIDRKNLIHGSERAVRAWAAAGADLFLGGHIHLPYVRPLSDRYPGLPRPCWVVQAGTALSNRVRGAVPNSFNVIHYQKPSSAGQSPQCKVQQWDFQQQCGQFQLYHEQETALHTRL